ncbi:hypothetical protein EJB05_56631, partial [Eragrostis curvula]
MDYINQTRLCPPSMNSYITNLTSSYTDKSNEPTMVSASVIMFVLAGLFFNLNLFSGISDVSAILEPKVRLVLSSALSLFLPVMSYLFSEAKNSVNLTSSTASTTTVAPDLPLRAGLILTWMLLVELLRKKVDEIRMRGYSSTIQRAGRVVWMGNLVFFTIQDAGRKAVFSILWILCAIKVLQRIAFTEVGKRSYAHGKNAQVLTSYMSQMIEHDRQERDVGSHNHVNQPVQRGNELMKRCKYIVMGEEKLVKKATADGYELNEINSDDNIVTVGKVWGLAERDPLFTRFDKDHHLKRLCVSFALFKLLRRRFEHMLPEMPEEETRDCRDLILKGLYSDGEGTAGEAVFKVINDEVNFLGEYYHSVVPVVLASPFFLLANYFLLPIVVLILCLMTIILCGNGDVRYAFSSLHADNYTLQSGVVNIAICLISRASHSPSAFFSMVDLSITILLFIIFFYEEIWEFLVFLLSNWFMVSLLCNYTARRNWRESPTFSGIFRRLVWLRSKMSHAKLTIKQFSVMSLRWPLNFPLFAMLSLTVRTELVPSSVRRSIMECLVEHDQHKTPLNNGNPVLVKYNFSRQLTRACASDSVTEVILTWHIATCILEMKCPPNKEDAAAAWSRTAIKLSNYCAYLVAFHPELLPDNKEKAERVFEDMKAELKGMVGCPVYFLSSQRARVNRIIQCAQGENTTETPADCTEIEVESACQKDQNKVVMSGAKLAILLMKEAEKGREEVWKMVAEVWTELIIFVAPSNDEERVKGHEDALVQGGEFITVLWALTTHIGISRSKPQTQSATTGGHPEA